jgi:hypothetical protein
MENDVMFQAKVQLKRARRMSIVDRMSPEMKALVHEYGLHVVWNFVQCGVTKPNQIKHLVECVLDEFSPTRGAASNQGTRRAEGWKMVAEE